MASDPNIFTNLFKDRYMVCYSRPESKAWHCTKTPFTTIDEANVYILSHMKNHKKDKSITTKMIPVSGMMPNLMHKSYLKRIIKQDARAYKPPEHVHFIKE